MSKREKPKTTAERLEFKAKLLAESLFAQRKQRLEAAGQRPYNGTALSPEQRLAQYGQIRRDPDAWGQILQRAARVKDDGRVLLPKKLLAEVSKYEGELRNGSI